MSDLHEVKSTPSEELERQIMSSTVPKSEREWWAHHRIQELVDLCIWMTGCGYDFCQHDYFCEQRDKLLKAKWEAICAKREPMKRRLSLRGVNTPL